MDNKRYSRNIRIEAFGKDGQRRLSEGSVFIVGCGALGSVAAMYLAAAGVGKIGIADFDTVDLTNLQRQVFFEESQCGKSKAELLASRMSALNSEIKIEVEKSLITKAKGIEIFGKYDVVLDATDNPASKYMIDDVCKEIGVPCVIGGVAAMRGQLFTAMPGGLRFRDLFPETPEDSGLTPCSLEGVIGPAAGIMGSLQAMEAIKVISGVGVPYSKSILTFDLLSGDFKKIAIC